MSAVSAQAEKPSPRIPSPIIRAIWMLHRRVYAITRGRFGLRPPTSTKWGMLRLRTIGRRTGKERFAILGYIDDGPNLVIPAMNGWLEPEPAWWFNLQANPHTTVELHDGRREVVAHAADPEERQRLWDRLVALGTAAYTNANAATRPRETAIVVLEPRG